MGPTPSSLDLPNFSGPLLSIYKYLSLSVKHSWIDFAILKTPAGCHVHWAVPVSVQCQPNMQIELI